MAASGEGAGTGEDHRSESPRRSEAHLEAPPGTSDQNTERERCRCWMGGQQCVQLARQASGLCDGCIYNRCCEKETPGPLRIKGWSSPNAARPATSRKHCDAPVSVAQADAIGWQRWGTCFATGASKRLGTCVAACASNASRRQPHTSGSVESTPAAKAEGSSVTVRVSPCAEQGVWLCSVQTSGGCGENVRNGVGTTGAPSRAECWQPRAWRRSVSPGLCHRCSGVSRLSFEFSGAHLACFGNAQVPKQDAAH